MKILRIVLGCLLLQSSSFAQNTGVEPTYPIWSIEEDLPHDHAIRYEDSRLLVEDGDAVGLVVGEEDIEPFVPELPDLSGIDFCYYGYKNGETIKEFSEQELNLIYEILRRFSYRSHNELKVFKILQDGDLREEALDPSEDYLSLHLCSLGVYLKLKDGQTFVIDGHPDSRFFRLKQKPYQGFTNKALNVFLTWAITKTDSIQPVAGGDATR